MSMVLWDQSRFDEALKARIEYGGRTIRQSIVTAAYWIAVNAKQAMPFVPIGKIDTELNVEMVNGVIPGTNRKSKAKKNRVALSLRGGASKTTRASLGLMILLARANLTTAGRKGQSNYNRLTNNRYALSPGDLAGKGTVQAFISRMIKARHSSPHFLQIGWNPAIRGLLGNPNLVNKYRRGGEPSDRGKKWNTLDETELGGVTIDLGADDCSVTIQNDVGEAGLNQSSHRAALLFYGSAALQVALDKEASLMEDYLRKHSKDGDEPFNARMK